METRLTICVRQSWVGKWWQRLPGLVVAGNGAGDMSIKAVYSPCSKANAAYWMHEDPVTKSKRVTDSTGGIVSTIELDPWGADTSGSNNAAFQPHKYTSYERDGNASD